MVLTPAARQAFPNGTVRADSLPSWTPDAAAALFVLAAVGVFATGQLGPRPPLGRGWRVRFADGLPYLLSSGLAGAAGIAMAYRTGGLTGTYFTHSWFDILAAVLLGGTWFGSGRPNVVGTVLALLLLRALQYGLVWLGVSPYVLAFMMQALLAAGVVVSIAAHALRARRSPRPSPGPASAPGAPPPPSYVA